MRSFSRYTNVAAATGVRIGTEGTLVSVERNESAVEVQKCQELPKLM